MAGVSEEVGVGLVGVSVHALRTLKNGHGVSAGVGLSARLGQVAVGEGHGESALLDVIELLTRAV